MNEEMIQQMMVAAERLAAATETLDRVLGKLDAQQEVLNAKVDRIVAAVELVRAINVASELKRCTGPYVETVLNWQARAAKLNAIEGRSPIGCIDNFATHAFHGSKTLRAYGERWALLQKWDFNPATDIARDYQGLWRWTGNKPGLRDDVARYFVERSEDGPLLLGEAPLV
jgi:hypothetical protein